MEKTQYISDIQKLFPRTINLPDIIIDNTDNIAAINMIPDRKPTIILSEDFCKQYNFQQPIEKGLHHNAKKLIETIIRHEIGHLHGLPSIGMVHLSFTVLCQYYLKDYTFALQNILTDIIINQYLYQCGYLNDDIFIEFEKQNWNYFYEHIQTNIKNQNDYLFTIEELLFFLLKITNLQFVLDEKKHIEIIQQINNVINHINKLQSQQWNICKDILQLSKKVLSQNNTLRHRMYISKQILEKVSLLIQIHEKEKNQASQNQEKQDDNKKDISNIIQNQVLSNKNITSKDNCINNKEEIEDAKKLLEDILKEDINNEQNIEEIINKTIKQELSKKIEKRVGHNKAISNKELISKILDIQIDNSYKYSELLIGQKNNDAYIYKLPLNNLNSYQKSLKLDTKTSNLKRLINQSLQQYGNPTTIFSIPPYSLPYQINTNLYGYDLVNKLSDICFIIDTSMSVSNSDIIEIIRIIMEMFDKEHPENLRLIFFSDTPYLDIKLSFIKPDGSKLMPSDILTAIILGGGIQKGGTFLSSSINLLINGNDDYNSNTVIITDACLTETDAQQSIKLLRKIKEKGLLLFFIATTKHRDQSIINLIKHSNVIDYIEEGDDFLTTLVTLCANIRDNYDYILQDIVNKNRLSI